MTRFQNELPQLDLDLVRANIRSALALWNTYPGVDYRLVWSGDRQGADATGCRDGSYPANGELTIRAEAQHPAAFASALFEPLPNITRAAEAFHRIHTVLGDGTNYFPETRIAHSWDTTHYGVAAAYGQSRYVIAWTLTNDSRQIAYKHSQDGINWSNHQIVQYNGTSDYSSMWEPVLAYSANRNVFLLAWTNWQIAENDDSQGHVRVCVNPNISGGVFGNCVEYYVVSNTPPALACHSTNNECILAWVNHIGYYDNHVSFRKGWVNNNNQFELYGTGYYFVTPSGTDLAPSLAFGNGYWLIAWRLKDGSSSSITLRMASNNWPNWGDVRTVDTLVQVSPTVHFVGAKFVHYYVRR